MEKNHNNFNMLTESSQKALIPQMRLFCFPKTSEMLFFEAEEELIKYLKKYKEIPEDICVIDYLGKVAGRSDVIRETNRKGREIVYTAVDEDGYGIYNHQKSVSKGEFVWEYNYGSVSEMYSAFRDRGITFEDDIYAKIDGRNQLILKMCKEENLFGMGKNSK